MIQVLERLVQRPEFRLTRLRSCVDTEVVPVIAIFNAIVDRRSEVVHDAPESGVEVFVPILCTAFGGSLDRESRNAALPQRAKYEGADCFLVIFVPILIWLGDRRRQMDFEVAPFLGAIHRHMPCDAVLRIRGGLANAVVVGWRERLRFWLPLRARILRVS
jgi:hypothetical protein